jgi:SAM-dependent methyltransferase
MLQEQAPHWRRTYGERRPDELSWTEPVPRLSIELIQEAALPLDASIIDVGGGASKLAAELLRLGHTDVTVADIAPEALERAKSALGEAAADVTWIEADIRVHHFNRRFDLWHDRALFHFMVTPADRHAYLEALRRALRPGGHLVLATFGPDGPTQCSGLPVSRYGAEKISQALGTDFELVSSRLTDHRTPSGKAQQFLYAHLARRADEEVDSTGAGT